LRQQINDNPQLHPRDGKRHSPIAAVVLTNADVDHVAGLLTLRESYPLAIHATERVLTTLRENSIFNVLNPAFVDRRAITLGRSFEVTDHEGAGTGVHVEPFAVPGKVALYREDAASGPNFGTRPEDTIGLRIFARERGPACFYVPACATLSAALAARLRGAAVVLFDGTLWQDDEMIVAGVGSKTGQRMGHISISGPDGSLAGFSALDVGRKIYVHINNTNPVLLDDAPERKAVEAAGWQVGYDGMEFEL
jgi:pyrroloquinoline quinone biosynthesis protein B